jgi:hypothetical protein
VDRNFKVGDIVNQPNCPRKGQSIGRVIDVRDYGFEIWVETLTGSPRTYWTFADQLEFASVLDLLITDNDANS